MGNQVNDRYGHGLLLEISLTDDEAIAAIESAVNSGKKTMQWAHDILMDAAFTTDRERHARRDAAYTEMGAYTDGAAKT